MFKAKCAPFAFAVGTLLVGVVMALLVTPELVIHFASDPYGCTVYLLGLGGFCYFGGILLKKLFSPQSTRRLPM